MNDSDEIHTSDEEDIQKDDERVNMEEFVRKSNSDSSVELQPDEREEKLDESDPDKNHSDEVFTDMKGWNPITGDKENGSNETAKKINEPSERSQSLVSRRTAPDPPTDNKRADTMCGPVLPASFNSTAHAQKLVPVTIPNVPIPPKNPITQSFIKKIDAISSATIPDMRMNLRGSAPPPYKPAPIINGYLEEGNGDIKKGLRTLTWHRRYVDYVGNCLKISLSRDDSDCIGKSIHPLDAMFVSIQADVYIRLDGPHASFVFKAQNQNQALQWVLFLSQQCKVAPSAEGYTMKESGRKKILESRYLKLTAEGLLSWYTSENVAKPQGTIQLRGEELQHKNKYVHVKVDSRTYTFEFLRPEEALQWFNVMQWHAGRKRLEITSVATRKKGLF